MPLNVIVLRIFSARISLSCISFKNFFMPQEQHFEELIVEQHLVSRVKLGVGFPCIQLAGGIDHLMLRIERKTHVIGKEHLHRHCGSPDEQHLIYAVITS